MGGLGSGGWNHSGRATIEATRRLDASRLAALGALSPGWFGLITWGEGAARIALVAQPDRVELSWSWRRGEGAWTPAVQTVALERRPCRFGGARAYFVCACGGLVLHLYATPGAWRCRTCARLTYASRREREVDRASRRASRLRRRLGAEPGFEQPYRRPKHMRRARFERLAAEIEACDAVVAEGFRSLAQRLNLRYAAETPRLAGGSRFWSPR